MAKRRERRSVRRGDQPIPPEDQVAKPISDIAPEDAEMSARAGDRQSASDRGGDQRPGHPAHPTDEEIRTRAYDRYQRRGRTDGRADEDWYEAERELRSRR